ncbi:MAG: 8-oxo-(d)GTP phosphatase [Gaiellales bacterium]|jgi:8-oxo-dGTP diphosphatase|nr:8-oxo-(d)GTP phosphatase [Gaiellales bacterium]
MAILLVRHARAGTRGTYADDTVRPLDKKGRKQAKRLAELLAERPVRRILSSPYTRCVQTVEPLAALLNLEIELREELAEGAPAAAVLELMESLRDIDGDAVLCTHGDVIAGLIGYDRPAKKGSLWVLDPERDFEPVEYVSV